MELLISWPGLHFVLWLIDWNMKLDVVAQSLRPIFSLLTLKKTDSPTPGKAHTADECERVVFRHGQLAGFFLTILTLEMTEDDFEMTVGLIPTTQLSCRILWVGDFRELL